MDENLSETEKIIIFRIVKVLFIALVCYILFKNFPHNDLPAFQLALVMGLLSAFKYFGSIVYVFIVYLLASVCIPPQFFGFIAQLVK